jgi:hypothetical protein
MEEMNKTELILSLIQDNLINLKLIYGLELIGLISHDYYLNLGNSAAVFRFKNRVCGIE